MADVIDAIIAEALGEGPAGMAAVAHVIATRAAQTGKTPEQVVNEAAQFSGVTNPGSSVARSMKDPAVRAQVADIWRGVQNGSIPNPYPGADYFHTPQVNPSWSDAFTQIGQLGNHIFYTSGQTPARKEAPTPMAPIMRAPRSATAAIEDTFPSSSSENAWLSYANEGATRNQPLSNDLTSALSFLPELGVTMEVFSGGQPAAGEGPRVGSERHDHGGAADVFFYKDGKRLDWANPADLPIFEQIVQRGKEAGITGFGAGEGYMQPGSMHIGFGAPAVWGAGGKGSDAPSWLRNAYYGAPTNPAVGAINAATQPPIMRPGWQQAWANPGMLLSNPGAIFGGQPPPAAAPIMRAANAVQQVPQAIMRGNPAMTVAGRTAAIEPMLKRIMTGSAGGTPLTSAVAAQRQPGESAQQAYDQANRAAVERAIANSANPEAARRLNERLGNL